MILSITMLTIKILFTINSVKNYFFHRINIIIIKNYFIDYQIIKIYIFFNVQKIFNVQIIELSIYTLSDPGAVKQFDWFDISDYST